MNLKNLVKRPLIVWQDRKYRRALEDIRVDYADWIRKREAAEMTEVAGRSEGEDGLNPPGTADGPFRPESGNDIVEPQFCIFCRDRESLDKKAADKIADWFQKHPEAMVVYGDEDVDDTERKSPWFKPDWSPHTFRSFFYFGGVVAVRMVILERLGLPDRGAFPKVTEYRELGEELEGITFLAEKALQEAGAFRKGSRSVGHIPAMLCHSAGREVQRSYLEPLLADGENPSDRKLWKKDRRASEVWKSFSYRGDSEGKKPELLSVIIPSRDNPDTLETAVSSTIRMVRGLPTEIIIVDNGSLLPNQKKVRSLVKEYGQDVPIKYVYEPMEFNFSGMCNLGAARADGDMYLFLNDDVELWYPGCLEIMSLTASEEYTGAVGMKLYYPHSNRIQHTGITNLPMGPVHKLQFLEDKQCYYFGRNMADCDVLAVTGACLMVEKHKFLEAGGFPEELPVAFNDVDLCFTLHKLGYHNVVMNNIFAFHYESMSRGDDESSEKLERLEKELHRLYERHPEFRGWDPYYPEGLGREGLDTGIRPAYVTAGNRPQRGVPVRSLIKPGEYREDACLLVRVEYCGRDRVVGYGVVLGDDNACYTKCLLLEPMDGCAAAAAGSQTDNAAAAMPESQTDNAAVAMPERQMDNTVVAMPVNQTDNAAVATSVSQTDNAAAATPASQTDTAAMVTPESQTDTAASAMSVNQTDNAAMVTPESQTDNAAAATPASQTDTAAMVTPESQTDTAASAMSVNQTDTAAAATPESQTDTAAAAMPVSQTDNAAMAKPVDQTDSAAMAMPESQTDTAAAATPESQTDNAAAAMPVSQTDNAAMATPVDQTDNAAMTTPVNQTDNLAAAWSGSPTDNAAAAPAGSQTGARNVYVFPLKGQYRPDLEENMADQKNVGLSGFCVEWPGTALPPGTYRIGITARSKTGNVRLINWTERRYRT